MTNYNNGKIYKIESTLGNMVYYGSTTKKYLSQRMTTHRNHYNYWLNGKMNNVTAFKLFKEYGIENCKIILVENYPCESKDELTARESHYIRNFECVNKVIPDRTRKEYLADNKDKLLEKAKEYRKVNKDKIKEYYEGRKDIRKEYYEDNKIKLLENAKEYYENNKNKILEQKKIKYNCICGSCFRKSEKSQHERTKKHIKFLESQ